VINLKMVSYFLSRLASYPPREFCGVVQYLHSVDRQEVETVLLLLNELDVFLDDKNGGVVLAVSDLLVYITEIHSNLRLSLTSRLVPVLVKFIKTAKREFLSDLLDFVLKLEEDYLKEFSKFDKVLVLKPKDEAGLKIKKIQFISRIADKENCQETLNLLLNLLPQTPSLNQSIIAAAARISQLDQNVHQNCLKNFKLLIKSDRKLYLELVMEAELNLEKCDCTETVKNLVETIFANFSAPACSNTTVMKSVLGLLENFGHLYAMSPYVLEDIFQVDRTKWSVDMYECVLGAAYALFDHFPPAMQPILANIFNQSLKVRNHQLHFKIRIYYALLQKKALKS